MRTVLGRGPKHLADLFRADVAARQDVRSRHRLQLIEYRSDHWSDFMYPGSRPADYIGRSVLGRMSVYNQLPAEIVESAACVKSFQASLQQILVARAKEGAADWSSTFSPRVPWCNHPLREEISGDSSQHH